MFKEWKTKFYLKEIEALLEYFFLFGENTTLKEAEEVESALSEYN